VTGDYFGTLGIRRVAGRLLTSEDSHRAQLVCVVDEGFARQYWPGGDPLGRKLVIGSDDKPEDECFTIVGVVSAVKQVGLTETAGQGAVYFPYRNLDARDFHLVVRTERQPESLAPALRRLLREIDPGLPLSEVRPMEQRIAASVAPRRSSALLVAIFSAVAIALTAIGTYGALSYAVAQRRREIGVRLALGAHPGQIRDQFLATGTRLLALGVAAGLPGAWFAGRAMQGILFEVAPLHGAIFAGATLVIGVISFAACLLPAWRAAKVDPATALRAE
jgi:hypothetical protein